jgi:hypothetical protein
VERVHVHGHNQRGKRMGGVYEASSGAVAWLSKRLAPKVNRTEKRQFRTEKCQFRAEKCQFRAEKCQFRTETCHFWQPLKRSAWSHGKDERGCLWVRARH